MEGTRCLRFPLLPQQQVEQTMVDKVLFESIERERVDRLKKIKLEGILLQALGNEMRNKRLMEEKESEKPLP